MTFVVNVLSLEMRRVFTTGWRHHVRQQSWTAHTPELITNWINELARELEQWTQWSKRGAVAAELSRLMQLRRSVRLAGGTVTGFRVRSMPTGAASLGVDRDHLLLGTLNVLRKT